MPIPEPASYRPSVLYTSGADGKLKPASKEQRAQEMAAVYGVTMSTNSLTQGEIEQMRRLVQLHDAKNQNKIEVMDPNNPPKEQYRHQKFPMLVYNHEKSVPAHDKTQGVKVGNIVIEQLVHVPANLHTRTVNDEKELAKALKAGFQETPPVLVSPDLEEGASEVQQ